MDDESRILELLDTVIESGRDPEDVCADEPELLPAVRERWLRFRRVEAQIDEIFPSSEHSTPGNSRPPLDATYLPKIPGYLVESVLGRGGMGVVYKARHLKLNRSVAIKMLLAGPFAASNDLARLLREAQAEAALGHPNIVPIYDIGELDGLPFFTMEYLVGGTLAQKLDGIPLPAHEAVKLMVTLAGAVYAAHLAGIVHRDLKPSNVLLTEEGTPKIADFGLARRFQGESQITQTGALVGTPCYMAPEQATGDKTAAFATAVDIYTLGAMLYEMLTGRPPFQAETALETQRQVVAEEPVPPSRLNAKVPRDLETICLKCLRKEPDQRYPTAAALADDLVRFEKGEPILARPLGRFGRLWRWAKRKPTTAVLAATAIALALVAIGGALWFQHVQSGHREQNARREGREWEAVDTALTQADGLEQQDRWLEARAALDTVPSLQDNSTAASLRERLATARANARVVTELESIRLHLSDGTASDLTTTPEQMYAKVFEEYGIVPGKSDPPEVSEVIRKSAIRITLIAYLHEWLYHEPDNRPLQHMLDVADNDPWRRAFRDALAVRTEEKLVRLGAASAAVNQPIEVVSGFAGLLANYQPDAAITLLREVQQRHPGDFWINHLIGHVMHQQHHTDEAIGFFRVALAIRPQSDMAYTELGRALRDIGNSREAIACFRQALVLNPNRAAERDLVTALTAEGDLQEAQLVWGKALERRPPNHKAWYGYAQLCLFLRDENAYHKARTALLDQFGDISKIGGTTAERTALACLLEPLSGDELHRAIEVANYAVAQREKGDELYLSFLQGVAEYRQGLYDRAITDLEDAVQKLPNRPGPRLVLALAQFKTGAGAQARRSLAVAVRNTNWFRAQANHTTPWVNHVLRREAEATILPNLPAFLKGKYQPQDDDERLALVGICEFKGRNGTAANLFADVFSSNLGLADDLTADCIGRAIKEQGDDQTEILNSETRYNAIRCAALAGCGVGEDRIQFDDAHRTRWRNQARIWLGADLSHWMEMLQSSEQSYRDMATKMLQLWQADPDLAGIRDQNAISKLPASEQQPWLDLWAKLNAGLAANAEGK